MEIPQFQPPPLPLLDDPPIAQWIDEGTHALDDRKPNKRAWVRATGIIKCPAAILMTQAGVPATPLEARAKRVFRLGHIIEKEVKDLLAAAGHPLLKTQDTVSVNFTVDENYSITIPGHLDGYVEWKGKLVPVDVKSMSNFGFLRAEDGMIDEGYLDQAHIYMHATETKRFGFIAYRKETGHIEVTWVDYDPYRWEILLDRIRPILRAIRDGKEGDEALYKLFGWCVERQDKSFYNKPTGRVFARQRNKNGMPTTYCDYAAVCPLVGKGGYTFTVESGKPVWVKQAFANQSRMELNPDGTRKPFGKDKDNG